MPLLTKPDIRTMTAADLDEVLAIEQASFRTPWKREHFESELSGRYSFPFVAELGGKVVGYVCLMSLFEEAQIRDIAVSPGQRGRGIALALLEHACAVAREKHAEVLSLEVRVSSAAAIGLYQRSGFKRAGIRPDYYEASEDALLMEKNLKETT
ncbi:MAG: ribosomal protein S18-alanine N-acetyltransferase [Verrucomicrobia bacterium]|nr:ribosomal protein S18-alanine N-acetyltransferase [Deltaproteobacteria bacterium]